jgi:hypothetical protein
MNAMRCALQTALARGAFQLPAPGGGDTPRRHRMLFEVARQQPVSFARLVEAHTDALAILHEAERQPSGDGALYGVWASTSPGRGLVVDRQAGTVSGTRPFCSGLGLVDRALVTVATDGGLPWLIDLDVTPADTLTFDCHAWSSAALAATCTGTATFHDHPYDAGAFIGGKGWYLNRPGFWHGACGPAACWAGGAAALADHAEVAVDDNPHRRAQLGAMRAAVWSMQAMLECAGQAIDLLPDDAAAGQYRALALRHSIERACTEVLDLFGRALGPRPVTGSPALAQRFADVQLYLLQHHGERDLEFLADTHRRCATHRIH